MKHHIGGNEVAIFAELEKPDNESLHFWKIKIPAELDIQKTRDDAVEEI